MLHYAKKWNEYSLYSVNTSWFLRENLIFRTLRTALTIRNIKTNAYYPHIVFGYYGADDEWYRINYSIFQEFKNRFDEKIKIYKSNISIVDDVLGGANFFEYVFKYCDILKYIESNFIFFNGDFTGCSYLNHACHVVLLCTADKFGIEALDEISDLVLFNVLIVVCKHDRIDPNNYMLSNLTNRLLQLIDTSSVLETLKIKIEKELKSNVDTVYISPEKLKKLKNKDKYTENYIKSCSFGIIKLKGKEDGSNKK